MPNKPPPPCPKCGNAHQVWLNQITQRWTCHRLHCNVEIDAPIGHKDLARWHLERAPQGLTRPQVEQLLKLSPGTVRDLMPRIRGAYIAEWRKQPGKGKPVAVWKLHTGLGPTPPSAVAPWIQRALERKKKGNTP